MATRMTGKVDFFSSDRGFGTINPDDGREPIFFRVAWVRFARSTDPCFAGGESVEFEIDDYSFERVEAVNITAPGGADVQGTPRDLVLRGFCHQCGGRGHSANICPSPDRGLFSGAGPRVPITPGSARITCYICRGGGHLGNICPSPGGVICDSCSGVGHIAGVCPSSGGSGSGGGIICCICGGVGHNDDICPYRAVLAGKGRVCKICSAVDHVARRCTNFEMVKALDAQLTAAEAEAKQRQRQN